MRLAAATLLCLLALSAQGAEADQTGPKPPQPAPPPSWTGFCGGQCRRAVERLQWVYGR
jgi:hypothetical protein